MTDYIADLGELPVEDVEAAAAIWRRHQKWFPAISELRKIVTDLQTERSASEARRKWRPQETGRFVPMTDAGKRKVQRGLEELAAWSPTTPQGHAIKAKLEALGLTMLKRATTWVQNER